MGEEIYKPFVPQTTAGAKPESVFPYPNPFSSRAYSGLSRVNM